MFWLFLAPLGVPQAPPGYRLRGNPSKIALVVKSLLPWRVSMQNLKSLAYSIWAVGGWGWFENVLQILYLEETCRDIFVFFRRNRKKNSPAKIFEGFSFVFRISPFAFPNPNPDPTTLYFTSTLLNMFAKWELVMNDVFAIS